MSRCCYPVIQSRAAEGRGFFYYSPMLYRRAHAHKRANYMLQWKDVELNTDSKDLMSHKPFISTTQCSFRTRNWRTCSTAGRSKQGWDLGQDSGFREKATPPAVAAGGRVSPSASDIWVFRIDFVASTAYVQRSSEWKALGSLRHVGKHSY